MQKVYLRFIFMATCLVSGEVRLEFLARQASLRSTSSRVRLRTCRTEMERRWLSDVFELFDIGLGNWVIEYFSAGHRTWCGADGRRVRLLAASWYAWIARAVSRYSFSRIGSIESAYSQVSWAGGLAPVTMQRRTRSDRSSTGCV